MRVSPRKRAATPAETDTGPDGDPADAWEDSPTAQMRRATDIAAAVGMKRARWTREELLTRAHLDGVDTRRWWRAMGIVEVPDDTVAFGTDDLAMARALGVVISQEEGREEHVFRLARLLGGSFSRIAEAQTAVLDDLLAGSLPDGQLDTPTGRALALGSPEAQALLKVFDQSMSYVWRRHMFATLGRWVGADEDEQSRAVGFADISGFSTLSKRLDESTLRDVIERFEAEAVDSVSQHGGRVVKFIGDEVLFVHDTLSTAVDVAIELGERMAAGDPPVDLHCGLASGPTVTIGGDVFGTTVNLAKRLTDVARRGRVVMPREQAQELAERDDLVLHRVPRVFELKGVGRTPIVSVTRLAPKPAE